jgi:hypothetical protein
VRNFHVQQSWNSCLSIPDKIVAALHQGAKHPGSGFAGYSGPKEKLAKEPRFAVKYGSSKTIVPGYGKLCNTSVG